MKKLIPFLLLAACSSRPAFQKTEEKASGYTVQSSDRNDIFDVRALLPESVNPEFRRDYLNRAAGEECLARGSMFFDTGPLGPQAVRVVCYKRPSKRSLGVVMDPKSLKTPVVEDTVANSHAPFHHRDLVRKVGGVEIDSIGSFKEQIFRLSEGGQKEINVAVERSGIALSLEAPFSEEREAVFTPEALSELRNKVP